LSTIDLRARADEYTIIMTTKGARIVAALALLHTASAACDLAAPSIADATGSLNWVQTGPVMRLYTTKTYPRQMILSGTSSSVEVGTMFTPLCLTENYMVDKGCVVQCTETGLDFLTYCPGLDINTICKPYSETKMNAHYDACLEERRRLRSELHSMLP
jgi:hypothetical protein